MSEPHQTPLQEAISFLTIGAIIVGVACYTAARQNLPIATPALFWVASIVYHWVPGLDAIRAPQMPLLMGAAAIESAFLLWAFHLPVCWALGSRTHRSQMWSGRS